MCQVEQGRYGDEYRRKVHYSYHERMPFARSTPTESPETGSTARPTVDRTCWLDGLLVLCTAAFAGLLGSVAIRNSDLWLHLATGRAIADGTHQFGVDPFCYTTTGLTWINPAWLFDLGLYWVYSSFSGAGVVALRVTMMVILGLIMMSIKKPGSSWAWPVLGTSVALIAANPRLIPFQPVMSSYLNLALLILVLHASTRFHKSWLLPFLVGLIQVHWVNHDGWFMLGPVVVGLWWIGSLFEPKTDTTKTTSSGFITWVVSLIACLANPHFCRIFVLPDELLPSFFDESIRSDALFSSYLAGPFDGTLLQRTGPAATSAFYVLLLVGLVSLALNFSSRPISRLAIWLLLAGLACWRTRLIPFFAVGATPLTVLNIQDVISRSLTPNQRRDFLLAGRGLALVAVLGACFAAWPGWLGPRFGDPTRAARVNPKLDPDRGLEAIGSSVREWNKSGQLTVQDRSYSPALDVAHYMAWFDPHHRSYLDTRWRLFEKALPDFLKARKVLTRLGEAIPSDLLNDRELQKDQEELIQLTQVLNRHLVTFVVLNGQERNEGVGAARFLWKRPSSWPMWGLVGHATAFGTDGKRATPRLEPGRAAFEPQSAAPRPMPLRDEPLMPTFWSLYLSGTPARSVDLFTALTWLEFIDAASSVQKRDVIAAMIARATSSAALTSVNSLGGCPLDPFLLSQVTTAGMSPSRLLGHENRDVDVVAAATLALHAARSAQVSTPDDPIIYFALAGSFQYLPTPQRLQQMRIATACTQLRSRLPLSRALGRPFPDAALAATNSLFEIYWETGQLDLAAAMARESLALIPEARGTFTSEQARDQMIQNRRRQLEQLEQALKPRREQYELQTANQPTSVRMRRAMQLQMPGEAIEVMQAALRGDAKSEFGLVDVAMMLDLMIRVGRAEDARAILMSPRFHPVTAVEPAMQAEFRRLHIWAAAACGDVALAREEMPRWLEQLRVSREQAAASSATAVTGLAFASALNAPMISLGAMGPLLAAAPSPIWEVVASGYEYQLWDALLALEAGDTRAAKRALEAARADQPPGIRLPNQELVDYYLSLLGRFEK